MEGLAPAPEGRGMTREQKWLRAELEICEEAIASERARAAYFGSEDPVEQKKHRRARADMLRRITAIVERDQASDRFLGGALCALACIAAHEDATSTIYSETARSFGLADLIREARRTRDGQLSNLLKLKRSIDRRGCT